MDPLISIIIPAYNVEGLIDRCIESIPRHPDVEIVVVNDCSTDRTAEILKQYNYIKVINLPENKGNGYARNVGIENTTGKGIYQVDADDYIIDKGFNEILINIREGLYDSYDMVNINNKINTGDTGGLADWRVAPWTYFIKRDFLGDLRFPTNIRRTVDGHLMQELRKKSPKLFDSNILCYWYNSNREGSLTWEAGHKNG